MRTTYAAAVLQAILHLLRSYESKDSFRLTDHAQHRDILLSIISPTDTRTASAGTASPSPPTALLDAAFHAFAERGYRATRLEAVAEAAGMTKGAIYYHFAGKEDLLRRALKDRHRTIFEQIETALRRERAPAAAKIRFLMRKVWQHWMEPGWGHVVRLMVGEVSVELPTLFRTWAQEGPVYGWSLLRDLIESGIRAGEFRSDVDPDVAARVFFSGLMMQASLHVHLGLDEIDPCDPDRLLDSALDVFLHGLAVTHRAPETA